MEGLGQTSIRYLKADNCHFFISQLSGSNIKLAAI